MERVITFLPVQSHANVEQISVCVTGMDGRVCVRERESKIESVVA